MKKIFMLCYFLCANTYALDLLESIVLNCKKDPKYSIQVTLYNPSWPMGAYCARGNIVGLSSDSSGAPMACFKGEMQVAVRYPMKGPPITKNVEFSIHNFLGKQNSFWLRHQGNFGYHKMEFSFEPEEKESKNENRGSIVVFPLQAKAPPVVFNIANDCYLSHPLSRLTEGLWLTQESAQE
jgi:hypothetical protein